MEQITLEVKHRKEKGKVLAKRLRSLGMIPGIVYGKETAASFPVFVETQRFDKILHQGAAHKIILLQIEQDSSREEKFCVIQEIQRDAFGDQILHVDFHHISMEEKLQSKVPLTLHGEAIGVKDGGVVDQVLWEIKIEALPINLPEKLVLDITPLAINQSFHVRDIPVPEGVTILEDREEVAVVIHPPRIEETPVAVAAAEAGVAAAAPAQPEVITKGKKEEETLEEKPAK